MIKPSFYIFFPATGLCFGERNIYTAEVLAFVLQQLMEQPTLPTLFMRTVIQTLTHYPKLLSFIMNVLQRLISRQVGIKFLKVEFVVPMYSVISCPSNLKDIGVFFFNVSYRCGSRVRYGKGLSNAAREQVPKASQYCSSSLLLSSLMSSL